MHGGPGQVPNLPPQGSESRAGREGGTGGASTPSPLPSTPKSSPPGSSPTPTPASPLPSARSSPKQASCAPQPGPQVNSGAAGRGGFPERSSSVGTGLQRPAVLGIPKLESYSSVRTEAGRGPTLSGTWFPSLVCGMD